MILFGIISIIFGVVFVTECNKRTHRIFGVILLLIGYLSLQMFIDIHKPKAIDVYRGKTELKITYIKQDSTLIATDTIVVFKNKQSNYW